MVSDICYKEREVGLNNFHFGHLISLAIEIGRMTCSNTAELKFVDRLDCLMGDGYFWPGRGMQIEDDFPDIEEQKFWARAFLDTARVIFDRKIGDHEHEFWQAQRIYQAYGTGQLFILAVKDHEPRWLPDSIDYCEFDLVVNKKTSSRTAPGIRRQH